MPFASRISTNIWHEKPSQTNPYISEISRLHGYEFSELVNKKSFIEVLYLLFKGELPTTREKVMLEHLMVGLINPGPRHPAVRASMTAGVSKTRTSNILPIGLTLLGGKYLGTEEVENAVRFFQDNCHKNPKLLAEELLQDISLEEGDVHIIPGIGSRFGGLDPISNMLAKKMMELEPGKVLQWGFDFVSVTSEQNIGWLNTGIAAAVLADLDVGPREAAGLFQLFCAPGILAHGLEQTHKPVTAMPFIGDENYVIEQ